MPSGQGNDEEIFAAAVEFGTPPGLAGDVGLSRDLDIVALLRSAGDGAAPRPDERARARAAVLARVMAAEDPSDHAFVPAPGEPELTSTSVLPPAVEDEAPAPEPAVDELAVRRTRADRHRPSRRRSRPGTSRHSLDGEDLDRRTPLGSRIVMAAAAALLGSAVIGGAGVLASGNSLPGDSLYALKQVAEQAELAATFDDADRGRRHLELAASRIDELERLLREHPESVGDPEVYRSALRDFSANADEGARLLLASTPPERRAQTEADLRAWAADQAQRLAELRGTLPGPAATDAGGTLDRLQELAGPSTQDGTAPVTAGPTPSTGSQQAPGSGAGPTATERRPSGDTDRSGGGQQSGGEPGLLDPLLPGDPLGPLVGGGSGQQAPNSTPDSGGGSDSGGQSGGGGGLEVPPLLPGLPGLSVGG